MELERVKVEKEEETNVIIGQSHFIKTVEDIYEAMTTSVPDIKFGLAFCEASGDRLIRYDGTDEGLKDMAVKNAEKINAGHFFILMMKDCFPINVMGSLKNVPEVCRIYCATANPLEVIVADTESGRGIMGVIDGQPTVSVEDKEDKEWRREFLQDIGYKR
ncbi:MAG: adenosine-specific kinase [Candidatus Thermoplasmatota archaeon]|nr:adenosine-specific kinase [Candidatus Thermoplasmatota archaeon]